MYNSIILLVVILTEACLEVDIYVYSIGWSNKSIL